MPKSAYIHIPFCKSKCKYCSFVSFSDCSRMENYIFALRNEILNSYEGEGLKTLYFGGGTPSLLTPSVLKNLTEIFNFSENPEITIELNPDDITAEYLAGIKDAGINRISIGSQTFDDNILKLIGRRHNSAQIINSVESAKKAGFENISLDLIYGLPNQTLEGLEKDLKNCLMLDIQHLSTYGLKIDDGSYWRVNPPKDLPDDDTQADMYELINDIMTKNGFRRYEVSNFSKSGYESKHNLNYWNNSEYYGFGVSAHGYKDGVRYSNFETLEEYLQNPTEHKFSKKLSEKEMLEESIFLGFRKTDGINVKEIEGRFGINFSEKYKSVLNKYSDFIEKTEFGYALNLKGTLISNVILSEFI